MVMAGWLGFIGAGTLPASAFRSAGASIASTPTNGVLPV